MKRKGKHNKKYDIKAHSPSFWQKKLRQINKEIEELEKEKNVIIEQLKNNIPLVYFQFKKMQEKKLEEGEEQ